jgi:hypothetical protein
VVLRRINYHVSKFLGILVALSLIIYLLTPVNFAAGIGYVTSRSIAMSYGATGFSATTLAAAITSTGATTMTVNSSAGYPSVPFVVTIGTAGSEAIEVTAMSGNTWTIVRGYLGTPTTTYLINAAVSGPATYSTQFVPYTPASSIQAIVIDFCSDSPIYNSSTCFTPTGMTIGASSATAVAVSSITGISSSLFTTNAANNTNRNDVIFSNSGVGYTPLTPTTLSAAITTTGATSISVTSSANYPVAVSTNSNTWFYITIPSTGETMQVTNVSGTTWTVVRGALGTTAATALISSAISQPPIAFTFYGVMNPTLSGALYARIYTFNNYSVANTFAAATASSGVLSSTYATASVDNIDAGGIALYITAVVSIDFKVQEFLQFCLYTAVGTSTGCNLTGSTITLGNSQGVLSLSNAYVDSSTRFDISTNASGYAALTFSGLPPSNGVDVVENSSVSGTGTVATSAYSSSVGTTQFGLCAIAAGASYQANGYTSANLTFPNNTYNNANCPTTEAYSAVYSGSAQFGFNIPRLGSIYGDLLAVQKPGTGSTGLISFLGNVSSAILAGSYSTTLTFVASGTY